MKCASKSEIGTLAREIHHHRRLHHPHIAKLYEVIGTENDVWLAMEYCSNGELYDYLLKHQCLTEPEAAKLFAQLCSAVAFLHAEGVVHRDLKLENIFLDSKSNIKLGDFGFTREFERNRLLETWCGTVAYAAPEMIRNEKYFGEAIDAWSLGIILFALLVGHLPFDEDDEVVTKQKILSEEPAIPERLSQHSSALIKLLLSKDATERPSIRSIFHSAFFTDHHETLISNPSENATLFSSPMEKLSLDRLNKAGIERSRVMKSVVNCNADSLSAIWYLTHKIIAQKEESRDRRRRGRRQSETRIGRKPSREGDLNASANFIFPRQSPASEGQC